MGKRSLLQISRLSYNYSLAVGLIRQKYECQDKKLMVIFLSLNFEITNHTNP